MQAAAAIAILRDNQVALRHRGVTHAALFGSTVRDAAGPDSDVDILVEIDPKANLDVYAYVGIKQFIASLFDEQVDVADFAMLIEPVRASAVREAVYAF